MGVFRQYRFGFDFWGLLVFLAVMVPTLIWYAVPAPVDILRTESSTPAVDAVGSVFQVLSIACLCCLIHEDSGKHRLSLPVILVLACILLYYLGWIFYYRGIATPPVILLMSVPPCAAFVLYAIDRKNLPAIVFASGFTVCHLYFAFANFISL